MREAEETNADRALPAADARPSGTGPVFRRVWAVMSYKGGGSRRRPETEPADGL